MDNIHHLPQPEVLARGSEKRVPTIHNEFYFNSLGGYLLLRDYRKREIKEKEKGALMLP
jgi:hypothetical protein